DARLLNIDETGHQCNKEAWWTWCLRADLYTIFKIDPHRSAVVLMDLLGRDFQGVIGCDYFSAYRRFMRECGVTVQFCMAHILRDLTKAVLGAVAKLRKALAAEAPKVPRGRPASKAAKRAARLKKRLMAKVADLFEHRYLFVRKHLTASERKTLARITRGQPQLHRLRELMEEIYRLFDRRCRMATALAKLARLRAHLRRFVRLREVLKKLFSPSLEKALMFLDDKGLGTTSNAVERGNRRYRKMQKTVYRVRTQEAIEERLALDLLREQQAGGRSETIEALHLARAA
ncbi:IS66 family transposase, partial [Singulisphaera rosea]